MLRSRWTVRSHLRRQQRNLPRPERVFLLDVVAMPTFGAIRHRFLFLREQAARQAGARVIMPGRLLGELVALLGIPLAVVAVFGVEVAAAAIGVWCARGAVVKGTRQTFAQLPVDVIKWQSACSRAVSERPSTSVS